MRFTTSSPPQTERSNTQPYRWGSAFGLAPTAVLGPIRAAAPRRAVGNPRRPVQPGQARCPSPPSTAATATGSGDPAPGTGATRLPTPPTVTRDHRAQDRISSRRRRRHGQPELAEAPAALLTARHGGPNLCLPSGLSILTGWPLRARPRPALTLWAQGLANFSPSRSPTGRWENCAPEPCTPAA